MSHLKIHRITKVSNISSFQSRINLVNKNSTTRTFHCLPTVSSTTNIIYNQQNNTGTTTGIIFSNTNDDFNSSPHSPFQSLLKCHYSSTSIQLSNKFEGGEEEKHEQEMENKIIYEGPFASLSKRLKRISVTSAIVSIIGIPLLITFHSGDVPASGQLAVGSTAIIAATGSTAALSFCFGPYVNTLEYVSSSGNSDDDVDDDTNKILVKATTTNIFGMNKVTIFDPEVEVTQDSSTGKNKYRPFCNFLVRDEPFYIHPELLQDDFLRVQLVGEEKGTFVQSDDQESGGSNKNKNKALDDDFL